MPLPIAHALVGASVVVVSRSRVTIDDWKALTFAASLAVLPDFDFFLTWFVDSDELWHRGFSHSVFFAVIIGIGAAALAHKSFLQDAVVYGAATLSHCLLDVFTTKSPGGVELFWPFWFERFRLGIFDYPWTVVPHPAYETWTFITLSMLGASFRELFVFLPLFVLLLAYKRARSVSRNVDLQATASGTK